MLIPEFYEVAQRCPDEAMHLQRDLSYELRSAGLHVEGAVYPLSPLPMTITPTSADYIANAARVTLRVLEHAAGLYRSDPDIRVLFPRYRSIAATLGTSPQDALGTWISRFDGFVDPERRVKFVELNAACPGGVLQMGLAARVWARLTSKYGIASQPEVSQTFVSEPYFFIDSLLAAHQRISRTEPELLVVANLEGAFTLEVDWMRKGILARGKQAEVVDLRAVTVDTKAGAASIEGRKIDLVYHKLRPADLPRHTSLLEYLQATQSGRFTTINPLLSQCITNDKGLFAVVSDPRWADRFTADQRATIAAHIPWTRFLRVEATTAPDGAPIQLATYAKTHRHKLVIKPVHLNRSTGVYVGPALQQQEWEARVEHALGVGSHVVQEYLRPPTVGFPPIGDRQGHTREFGLDVFLFGDILAGFQCRAAKSAALSVTSGASLMPVVITSHVETPERSITL